MKKLVVLFLLMFISPLLASGIDANATDATCDNTTLETYSGTANVEINWVPNTINLSWYNGNEKMTVQQSAQTCSYDDLLTIPSTQPTRTGYTFVGWTVRMPGTYTELEYIQSTGSQWIDTGIKGRMNYTYEIDFQQTDTGFYRNWGVFGQSGYIGLNMSLTYINGGVFAVRWEFMGAEYQQQRSISLPSINTNRHLLKINNGHVYWDGTYKGISTGHDSNLVINYNLFLGTVNPAGNAPSANAHSKYYSYKVWDNNGNLIQDFIPARRNSDNVVGMYDTVTQTFFTNAGTGTFTAGPVAQ